MAEETACKAEEKKALVGMVVNDRIIDPWTFVHLVVATIITYALLTWAVPIIVIGIFIVMYEVIEHLLIGDLIFHWEDSDRTGTTVKGTERAGNTIFDIIAGLIGIYVGFELWLVYYVGG